MPELLAALAAFLQEHRRGSSTGPRETEPLKLC